MKLGMRGTTTAGNNPDPLFSQCLRSSKVHEWRPRAVPNRRRTIRIAFAEASPKVINMHAELEMKFKNQLDWPKVTGAIQEIIGANEVPASVALMGNPLAELPSVVGSALAAEQILNAATIVYFREGSDAIRVHIKVRSLSETKKQCTRIARQLPRRIGTLSTANGDILVRERETDEALIKGERRSLQSRIWSAVSEKFVSKIVPSAVTFALASYFFAQEDAKISAAIGFGAAIVGVLFEAALAANASSEWKWKELS
ncbi:MAG: hypothetical protein ACXW3Z_16220 [Limisphaerales bacterium]